MRLHQPYDRVPEMDEPETSPSDRPFERFPSRVIRVCCEPGCRRTAKPRSMMCDEHTPRPRPVTEKKSCPDCGVEIHGRSSRCNHCAKLGERNGRFNATDTVRETTLRCSKCHEWKPDDEFWRNVNRPARRSRTDACIPCSIAVRDARRDRP